jgi:hypothetical protein
MIPGAECSREEVPDHELHVPGDCGRDQGVEDVAPPALRLARVRAPELRGAFTDLVE